KGDNLTEGYTLKLWDFTHISVTQNNLQELKEIWVQWDDEVKQLFYALIKQKGESKCIPWKSLRDLILVHPDKKKKGDVFALSIYGSIIFPKALGHIDEAVSELFDRLDRRVTLVPTILAKISRSLNVCWRTGEGRFIGCAQLLLAWFHKTTLRRDDIRKERWITILQNLQDEDVEWRAPWLVPDEILY
ncbi:hypothetical protein Goklo_004812, partial [Gossypium klotzschianum]|nr:hypothetical protein [Gossypium klotzschianum]